MPKNTLILAKIYSPSKFKAMKTYIIYGTNDHKLFIEKTWIKVAEVKAKNKHQVLKEFKHALYADNDAVTWLHFDPEHVSYKVKVA